MNQASPIQPVAPAQYQTADRFAARIALHRRYSTNRIPWPFWVFSRLELRPDMRVLELGCGTGMLWQVNLDRLPADLDLTLSDYSPGMLSATKNSLGPAAGRINFVLLDAAHHDWTDQAYDLVIANHMIYHLPAIQETLQGIKRVLKPNGRLIATTPARGNNECLADLVTKFWPASGYRAILGCIEDQFCMQNGGSQLSSVFRAVDTQEYNDDLEISESGPLVDYFLSFNGMKDDLTALDDHMAESFRAYLDRILTEQGVIKVPRQNALFTARA